MNMQIDARFNHLSLPQTHLPSRYVLSCSRSIKAKCDFKNNTFRASGSWKPKALKRKARFTVSSSSKVSAPLWENWAPEKSSTGPSLSDIVWPSAGAFAAMAILGKIDQILVPKGISMTIAPLGAVCAVLFATPASPGARKYNVFVAQIGCAAIGVLAFSIFGPCWLARSTALSAAIAFMILTRSVHPPAASLPLLFIDGVKMHHLNYWYALFPGAAGCILLCLIVTRDGILLEGQFEVLKVVQTSLLGNAKVENV
ncbi:hypothetical protein CASFOL_001095 [Castilleja foliolosa]|uniref:HPP transmembrane region domain-containing protein n=1 Tax=Castilleja foliolosa TaxID=1961234 RepID=A0ABD3EQG1_9LAMI